MLWNESAIERGQGFVSSSTFAEHPQLSVSLFDDSLRSRRDSYRVAGRAFIPVLQQFQERIAHTPKTSSGRSIRASLTASREADRNSSASEFPMGQNRASWSRVIGSLRSTPIPSAFAGDSAYPHKHVGGLSTEDIMPRGKTLTIPRR